MLMSRHGVTDSRSHAHSWGEGLKTRRVPSMECLMGAAVTSAETERMTAFRNIEAFTDDDREVAL